MSRWYAIVLKAAKVAGEASVKREKACKGHKPIKKWKNKKGVEWARCRCGLMAKTESKAWT